MNQGKAIFAESESCFSWFEVPREKKRPGLSRVPAFGGCMRMQSRK
jgi:hypothetical protein